MATPVTISGNAAILPLARRDLECVPIEYRGQSYWTIKDPVALRYYQLREEEHFLFRLLDGRSSLEDLVARFEQRFAPRRLRRTELAGFLGLLHREGLVASSVPGQGQQLLQRSVARYWGTRLSALTNVLAIRLPGINPDRFLTALAPWYGWLFSPACLAGALLLLFAAITVVALNLGEVLHRLPQLREFLRPGNVALLAVSLTLVKSLHELGHALTCKRFGGECNRVGIMLLVFTPALYCDVSDAWMFRERWQRMAVSAAGVGVELLLASIATLVWWMTQPGLVNDLSLNVMVICSVSTLLINGNPLLRYDGYYVFADWLGAPNLQQQASAAVRRGMAYLLTGARPEYHRLLADPGAGLLWSYAIAAAAYRCLALIGILWLLDATLRPLGLGGVTYLVALLLAVSLVAGPASAAARAVSNPIRRREFRLRRAGIVVLLIIGVAAAILCFPLPARVTAPVIARAADERLIHVPSGGVLEFCVPVGEKVSAGQVLARLTNHRRELEVAELQSMIERQELHVAHLALRQHREPALGDQLPAAERQLADLREQLIQNRRELERLVLVAPLAGTVLPPPPITPPADSEHLATFTGTPLQPHNLGCFLDTGALLCSIGDPSRIEALAVVQEHDIEALREGQSVRLAFDQFPGSVAAGRVHEISKLPGDALPAQLVAERKLALRSLPDGSLQPEHSCYQVVIALEGGLRRPLLGAVGRARIATAPTPLWLRVYRGLRGMLRSPW